MGSGRLKVGIEGSGRRRARTGSSTEWCPIQRRPEEWVSRSQPADQALELASDRCQGEDRFSDNYPTGAGSLASLTDTPRSPKRMGTGIVYPVRLAILCAAYFGAAKAGLAFAFANQSVSAVWPPTGIALAAVLIWGYRMWPAIAVGAFLANITTAGPDGSVRAIATGDTLEAGVGGFLW